MQDLQQAFANAQQVFQAGDYDRAASLFEELVDRHPEQPAMHHLLGLSRKRGGDLEAARTAFADGVARHPKVAPLHAELASLLDDLGEWEGAIESYDRAIALDPGLVDARIDRALVEYRHGSAQKGFRALRALAAEHRDNPRIWLNLAIAARKVGRMDTAQEAADRALALTPDNARLLRLRAQIALDRGAPAAPLFRKAREIARDDSDALRGEAAALLAEESAGAARSLLDAQLERHPDWYETHTMYARIAWESGDREAVTHTFERALDERPDDLALWVHYLSTLAQTLGHEAALERIAQAPASIAEDPMVVNARANSLCELDELDAARPLFGALADREGPGFQLPQVRFFIRTREFERAARTARQLVEQGSGADAWPYIAIAWRMMDDPRWLWLEGERELARYYDLDDLAPEIDALAARLRGLHRSSVAPFEQSLRGGTQTDGSLFLRNEPEIRSLVGVIESAVARYIGELPPPDDDHPVLSRNRDDFHFAGSWSVRLTDEGYHVSHIHNQGWISSALYVALPPAMTESEDPRAGWLELGGAPREFKLDLEPLRIVEPKPARLALFPSIMWHGTRPFPAGERMTVAFDIASG